MGLSRASSRPETRGLQGQRRPSKQKARIQKPHPPPFQPDGSWSDAEILGSARKEGSNRDAQQRSRLRLSPEPGVLSDSDFVAYGKIKTGTEPGEGGRRTDASRVNPSSAAVHGEPGGQSHNEPLPGPRRRGIATVDSCRAVDDRSNRRPARALWLAGELGWRGAGMIPARQTLHKGRSSSSRWMADATGGDACWAVMRSWAPTVPADSARSMRPPTTTTDAGFAYLKYAAVASTPYPGSTRRFRPVTRIWSCRSLSA